MSAPTVGHFRTIYLELTETFIYQYLTHHQRYDPFVCGLLEKNFDKFPFEPRYLLADEPKWHPRVWRAAISHLLHLDAPYYERIIGRTDPDILHAHFGPMGYQLLDVRPDDVPLVTSFYGYDASQLVTDDPNPSLTDRARRLVAGDYREHYQRLFAEGDRFLVEGPTMREKLVGLGCPEEKIDIQRIAIDAKPISPSYPSSDPDWTVLMVGRFVEKKGMPDGIRAFARAFGDVEDAELRIIGGEAGEFTQDDLERIAAECGVGDDVTFLGYLEYSEYLEAVRSCDVVLAPSKTAESGDSEGGAPTVLLEAQAAGKPVVSTTHADIPFVVQDETTGLLSSPGDIEAIADDLVRLRDDPSKLASLGRNGREHVVEKHNVTTLVDQLEATYDDVRGV